MASAGWVNGQVTAVNYQARLGSRQTASTLPKSARTPGSARLPPTWSLAPRMCPRL